MTKEDWEAVIGLEVHAQVSSNTKLFSSSSTEFGAEHNTQVSLVDAAMPGTLPILNYYCIEQAIRTGLALSAEINKCSYFDRKNYFYPDLPQGYQITQFFEPIVKNGRVLINDNEKEIRIARIHLEQDAGKSVHEESKTYVDLNRAGVALMEIVSEPDLRSSAEAAECMKKLRQILRYTGSCDGDMEKGSLRCDANVSVRLKGNNTFGTRCEIKNLNSIRHIVQAIDYEIQRQIEILESGEEISQDTLLFDVASGKTKVMRSKEDASDYRYFPEPDLLPVEVSQEKIDLIQSSLPELPDQKKLRYIEELGINEYDANVITSDKAIANYFEELIKKHDSKLAVTWLTVELFGRLNKAGIDIVSSPIKANALSELLDFIVDGTISAKLGKQVFDSMFETGKPASLIIEEQDLKQITDKCQISEVIDKIINSNQDKVQEYKSGKTRLYGFFVGEVMKSTKGKASPDVVNSILSEKLDKVPEGYPAGGAKNFIHGIDYQKLWLMLFFRRAVNRKYFFRLATEMSSAAGFDDIVFLDEQNGTTVCMLIQVKHKQDDSKKICVGDLLTKSGELNLVKHFAAFLEIRGSEEFKDKIKDFFIVINVDFDYESLASKGITVEKIETQDEFLNIGDSAKYKLRDLHNNIAQYLEQGMSAGGREVSDEEIKGFLNELVFVVNSPNDAELEKLIRNEISDDLARRFKHFGDDGFFNALFAMISNWMKDKRGRFLLPEEGREFFQKVELRASTVSEIRQGVERIEGKVDEIGEVLNNQQARKEPIWFNMRYPVKTFTGRSSELKALHDALQKSTGKQAVISQVASISGLGGVGKSELARKYAYKYGKDYYVNAIWIDAESTETMKNSFLDLANNRLGIPTKDRHERDKTIENIVREVYAFFARRGRRSLFIFDNAEGYEDIKRFLPSSLHPRHKKPYILITSRDCKWNVRGEGDIKVIQLDEFGEVEALEFVRKALNIENNLQDREIEELTRELQYFPLALGQAVVYIQDRNEESRLRGDRRFKISDYLKEYQQNAGELLKKGVYENEDRYTKTVLTTWNITMTYICKEYGFEALSILEIMAYLAPDNIRIKEIFSKLITDDKAKLWNAVELLNRYSMIKLREGIVNIHRLVQKVTELNLQKAVREEEVLRKALELISSGDIAISHIVSIWKYASEYSRLIDDFYFRSIYSEQKYTPLHLLAESGDYEAVEILLTHIEERYTGMLSKVVNAKDGDGYIPLHLAIYSGKLDVVKCLISKGADINAKGKYGWTPLHIAAEGKKFDIVEHLTRNGADVNAEDKYDETPLCVAIRSGKLEVVKHFFNTGADVDKYNGTLLHLAVCSGKPDVVEYLISKGIDVNAKYHKMPLHLAASRGLGMSMFLIQKGADVNAKDGNTPLHFAAVMGKVAVAKILLKHNADVNTKNNEGRTALYYAANNNHQELVELLLAHGASHDY